MNTLIERVETVLSTTPERWQRLVSTIPGDILSRPPAAGEWSALNCLQHLLIVERRVFPVRVRNFLAGENFENFDPEQRYADIDAQTPEQLATEFANLRQDSLVLLRSVKDDDLERTVEHPMFGTVTLAQMLHVWAAHDLMHTVQAERALMQPFLLGCGPWIAFYQDHYVPVPEEER